ncbi:MAG: type II secretion system F family protein [Candidatus Eremiobacteraeota bacterium]|nr:type II secretion system F family protein [Candidatus Eremiobacteraeota bacterium]
MNDTTLSVEHLGYLFTKLKATVAAQRVLVLLGPDEQGSWTPALTHGVTAEQAFGDEPIALPVLVKVTQQMRPFFTEKADDLAEFDSNALLLSGIQAVLCVPLLGGRGQVVGMLYADDSRPAAGFRYTDMLNVQNLAQGLRARPSRPIARPAPAAPIVASGPRIRLRSQEEVAFFVQLSTLIKAGIPLLQGLEALAKQAESERVRELSERILKGLLKGQSLSEVLQAHGEFAGVVVSLVRCAERSGQLALSLELLAQTLDKQRNRSLRLSSSLIYPGFLMLLALAMVALMPTFLLKSQLEFYQAQKMKLPGLSLAFLKLGQWLSHPLGGLTSVLLVGTLLFWLRRPEQRLRLAALRQRLFERLPWTRRLQRLYWECLVLSSLHMLLLAGVDVLEGVRMAVESSGSFLWREKQPQILADLRNGEGLAQSLAASRLTSKSTGPLLAASEEAGRVAGALGWISRILESDFDHGLDTAGKVLEPLIMLLLGVLVGLITLASLLPSIRYIQEL